MWKSSADKKTIKRVLIVHPFGIGDALFVTPILRALHEQGVEKIDLILGSRTRELFETNPFVTGIYVIDRDEMRPQFFLKTFLQLTLLFFSLLMSRYDTLIDLSLSRPYALAATVLGIRRRVGFSYKERGVFLNHRVDLNFGFSAKHVVEYYLDLLKKLSIPHESNRLEMYLTTEDEQEAREVLQSLNATLDQPYLVVGPGGGESWGKDARLKRWPAEYFAELIAQMRNERSVGFFGKVLIMGGAGEAELGESLKKLGGEAYVNLCGKTSLRATAFLIKNARLMIANDGGLVHVASAVETPTIAIFGPVDSKIYGPYPGSARRIAISSGGPECRPCYRQMRYNAECVAAECLNQLKPEEAFRMVSEKGFFAHFGPRPKML